MFALNKSLKTIEKKTHQNQWANISTHDKHIGHLSNIQPRIYNTDCQHDTHGTKHNHNILNNKHITNITRTHNK